MPATAKKKQEATCKKEQGHLFVPACVAKSLTEAILNDIGESLQSEQLHEREEGRKGGKKREQRAMRRLLHRERERGGRRSAALLC